jgi:hypothetical protein
LSGGPPESWPTKSSNRRWSGWGAFLIGAWTLLKAVFILAFSPRSFSLQTALAILAAIVVGVYGGAIGGLTYAAVRPRVRHLGHPGDYLTGLTCASSCLLAFGVPLALFTSQAMFREPLGWLVMFVMATTAGLLIGRSWFKTDAPAPG